jgi:PAS domain S-box-containing protein
MNRIHDLLKGPDFQNEGQSRTAAILYFFIFAILTRLLILLSLRLAVGELSSALPILLTCCLVIVSIVVLRQRHLNLSGNILLWSLVIFHIYLLWKKGPIYDNTLLAIPGVIVIGSLILRKRYFIAFTLASLISIGLIAYLRIVGAAPKVDIIETDYIDLADLVIILSITAITVRLLSDNLAKSLARALNAEKEIRIQANELMESKERYQSLFEGASQAIIIMNGGKIIDCNEVTLKMFGYEGKESVLSRHPWDFGPKEQPDGTESTEKARRLIHAASEGKPQSFYWKHAKKDGSLFDTEVSLSRVELGDNAVLQAFVRDISDTKHAEVLQKVVYKISQAADQSKSLDDLYLEVHKLIGTVMPASNFYIALYDDKADVVSFPYFVDEIDSPFPPQKDRKGLTEYVIRTGKSLMCDEATDRELRDLGEIELIGHPSAIWIGVPLKVENKTIGVMVVQHYTDPNAYGERELQMLEYVSEQVAKAIDRKRAEEALHESQDRLIKAQAMAHVGNWEVDLQTRQVWGSEEAFRIFGVQRIHPSLPIEIVRQIILPEDRSAEEEALHLLISENKTYNVELRIKRVNDNETRFIRAVAARGMDKVGKLVKVVGVVQDITENKKLQLQFVQAQKMESIGILASGIAHDFNNILGIILGYSTLIEKSPNLEDRILKSTKAIIKAGQRATSLVQQMLTFARKSDISFASVSVNDCVIEIRKLVEETFPKTIALVCVLEKNLPLITADSTQIHQVLLNLCVNARDAMNGSGVLTISTKLETGKALRKRFQEAVSPEYAVVEVSDTGTGIDESTLQHIFEPFFTTKEPGKGTGMGLAVVFGIMESHGGFIDVKSELGRGAIFSLYFPIKLSPIESLEPEWTLGKDIPGGKETILVVEDEVLLKELAITILSSSGYRVLAANDGNEAVEVYKLHRHEISLVLSDFGLPKHTGDEVLKSIKQINPEVKFILATGYIDSKERSEVMKSGAKDIITKPYTPDDLLAKVREVLDM